MNDSRYAFDDELETLRAVLIERLPLVPGDDLTATAILCAKAVRAGFEELRRSEPTDLVERCQYLYRERF